MLCKHFWKSKYCPHGGETLGYYQKKMLSDRIIVLRKFMLQESMVNQEISVKVSRSGSGRLSAPVSKSRGTQEIIKQGYVKLSPTTSMHTRCPLA